MYKRQLPVIRFLLSCFCVMMPILGISFLFSHWTFSQVLEKNEKVFEQSVNYVCNKLDQSYQESKNDAIRISAIPELNPDIMLKNEISTLTGLNLIRMINVFRDEWGEIFLYYGSNRIYFLSGRHNINYFQKQLNCDTQSSRNAVELLSENQEGIELLYCNDGKDGYLLLHFPISGEEDMSVNYLISFDKFFQRLNALQNYALSSVQINFFDGNQLLLCMDEKSGFHVASKEAYESGDCLIFESNVFLGNAAILASYSKSAILRENQINQYINYFIIAIGILFSSLIAAWFGSRRKERLEFLETAITSNSRENQSLRLGDLEGIYQTILAFIDSKKEERLDYYSLLKQKITSMIFNGILKTEDEIKAALYQCNYILHEPYYFAGAVLYDSNPDIRQRLENIFIGDLFMKTEYNGEEIILFLLESSNLDSSWNYRKKTVERLIKALRLKENETVKAAISQVYPFSRQMANIAYMEVMQVVEAFTKEHYAGRIVFWESLQHDIESVLNFTDTELSVLSCAVTDKDTVKTEELLRDLCWHIDTGKITEENRCYLRHLILTKIITALNNQDDGKKYMPNLINIGTSSSINFEKQLLSILQKYCAGTHDDRNFQKILSYVQNHFTDHELTAEQVASQAGYTKFYLSKLFKLYTSYSYIDYLTKLRMDYACRLMLETDLSIKEIVEKTGYLDDSSFRKKFKKLYGFSVTEYRKRNKNI